MSGVRRQLSRNVVVLGFVSFLNDISSEMTLTILPLFLANVLGVRTPIIGLIEGVAETTASLTKIYAGWLSDRVRRRKALALTGYGLSALSKPLLYFANSWLVVGLIRFADRVGKGIRTAPRDALIADSTAGEHRGLSFGFHRALDTAGAVVGLATAAAIVFFSQKGALALERSTFQRLVLIAAIPGFLAVFLLMLGVRDIAPRTVGREAPPRPTLRGWNRRFYIFLLAVILFTLGNSADAFLILRAQTLGIAAAWVALLLVVQNITYTLVATPAGALSDRWGRYRLIITAWGIYALVYLGFAFARAAWHAWVLFAVYGVYYGIGEGVSKALVADVVAPEKWGTAYGLYHAAVGLTALPASLIAGVLWQGIGPWTGLGPAAPFLFGALMAAAAIIVLLGGNLVSRRTVI